MEWRVAATLEVRHGAYARGVMPGLRAKLLSASEGMRARWADGALQIGVPKAAAGAVHAIVALTAQAALFEAATRLAWAATPPATPALDCRRVRPTWIEGCMRRAVPLFRCDPAASPTVVAAATFLVRDRLVLRPPKARAVYELQGWPSKQLLATAILPFGEATEIDLTRLPAGPAELTWTAGGLESLSLYCGPVPTDTVALALISLGAGATDQRIALRLEPRPATWEINVRLPLNHAIRTPSTATDHGYALCWKDGPGHRRIFSPTVADRALTFKLADVPLVDRMPRLDLVHRSSASDPDQEIARGLVWPAPGSPTISKFVQL